MGPGTKTQSDALFEANDRKGIWSGPLTVAALVLLLVLGAASPALAAPRDLDLSFGDEGVVTTRCVDGSGAWLHSCSDQNLAIQADGKMVVGGGTSLSRYNTDGSLDASFGVDGFVDESDPDSFMFAFALQPDGKIVTAGHISESLPSGGVNHDVELKRYDTDGSLDTTFGTDGKLATPIGLADAFDSALAVVIQPDGKIVVAGGTVAATDDFALLRYNPDGSLDTSFHDDGKLTTDFGSGGEGVTALDLQDDGKIVAVGSTGHPGPSGEITDTDFALARYNPDGSLDTSFHDDGKLTTAFGTSYDSTAGVVVQPDGKVVVAGTTRDVTGEPNSDIDIIDTDFALARYNPDGSPDASFNGDGMLTTEIRPSRDTINDMVIQPDGKIVVAGASDFYPHGSNRPVFDFALARYTPDGALDTNFGGDGTFTVSLSPSYDFASSLALRPDGKIVTAGTTTNGGVSDRILTRHYGGEDATATGPVTSLAAEVNDRDIALSWTNPTDDDYQVTRVLRSTSDYATSATQTDFQTRVYNGTSTSLTEVDFADGTYYYTAFARDASGNWSEAAKVVAKVDHAPPDSFLAAGSLRDPLNDNTPTFNFSGSDNATATADLLFSYKVDDGTWSDYSSDTSVTLGGDSGLSEGPHSLYIRARDEAGNEDETPYQHVFKVDTSAPETTIDLGPEDVISASTARFEFSSEDGIYGAYSFRYWLDEGESNYTSGGFAFGVAKFGDIGLGEHTFHVEATDWAGNVGPVETRTFTVEPEQVSTPVTAGQPVSTDSENDGATASDPVESRIVSPVQGTVSITETPTTTTQPPSGYSLLGQQVNIEAPASTADNPLKLVFVLDSSVLPQDESYSTLQVFRNGVPAQDCAGNSSGVAEPDPCVLSRELLSDDDVKFTVLTSHASAWNFGVDGVAPTVESVTPADLAKKASATANVTATFSKKMLASTIDTSRFVLVKRGTTTPIQAKVSYAAATKKAILNPKPELKPGATYVATLKGGASGINDYAGNPLAEDKVWSFTIKKR